jgi:peptide/nickel transport system permease protein
VALEIVKTRVRKKKKLKFSLSGMGILLIAVVCTFANFFAPYDPYAIGTADPFASPSLAHFFGTDNLGRDLFSRVIYGGRTTLFIALSATTIALILGTTWGVLAGVRKGWADEFLMRSADAVMAIPAILFALVCISALGASVASLLVVAGLLLSPATAKMARSAIVIEMESDYVVAAIASGLTRTRLIWREVLPNIASQLLVQFSINAASAVMLEATLSFIGLGVQPPATSWGTLILQGYATIWNSYWFVLFPALTVTIAILLFNAYGERLRISMDSRKSSA